MCPFKTDVLRIRFTIAKELVTPHTHSTLSPKEARDSPNTFATEN